ncbi:MAG: P22 coat protein [Oscillospiraceae bacterium]|nr:P22 coat protein [Oscillospiraceae bacterium]
MANTFITIQEIARETLPRLIENLVFPNLIYKDFSDTFTSLGDTIRVRKPVVLEASEFDAASGVTAQDITEQTVSVKLDRIATVDVELSAFEGAMNVRSLAEQFLEPAAAALAKKINSDGLELYKDVAAYTGTAGTTPSALSDMAAVRKLMNKNGVPTDRRCALWDADADAALVQIPAIVSAEKSGSTQALRSGSMGRIMGLDNYMSQAVKTHAGGSVTGSPVLSAKAAAGATFFSVSGAASGSTVKKGDLLLMGGHSYTVTRDAGLDSEAVHVYPPVREEQALGTELTFIQSGVQNLAFHPMAFAFVCRPLSQPAGVESYTTSYNGVSLRVCRGYDMKYKKETLSMDVLYGFKTVYPELAVRCLG